MLRITSDNFHLLENNDILMVIGDYFSSPFKFLRKIEDDFNCYVFWDYKYKTEVKLNMQLILEPRYFIYIEIPENDEDVTYIMSEIMSIE